MAKVGIMGAGSWGTALSLLLHKNGHDVTVWSINADEVEMLSKEREHKSKLPGVRLPEDMKFTTHVEETVVGKDFVVLAVPSPEALQEQWLLMWQRGRCSSMWQRELKRPPL